MKNALALAVLVTFVSCADAWNDKGHMVVARLAWNRLKPDERKAILKMLEAHPHHDEYLKAKRPDAIPQDEWVFMRAATWADWVRGGPPARQAFNRPKRHYINLPFVQEGSEVKPPRPSEDNIVTALARYQKQAKAGSREEQAVALTFLFHFVGDIHQPLHCFTRYSDAFPKGDLGGNLAVVRMKADGKGVKLHGFWDGLLGNAVTRGSILGTVEEVETLAKDNAALKKDLEDHKTPTEWAEEGFALARDVGYLKGKLKPANTDTKPEGDALPTVPAGYPETAGATARYCVAKAGDRLAQVLRQVIKDNAPPTP